jgi:hypothetical protein
LFFQQRFSKPNIDNHKTEFIGWKNLNHIAEYENSTDHRENFCDLKFQPPPPQKQFRGCCIYEALQEGT